MVGGDHPLQPLPGGPGLTACGVPFAERAGRPVALVGASRSGHLPQDGHPPFLLVPSEQDDGQADLRDREHVGVSGGDRGLQYLPGLVVPLLQGQYVSQTRQSPRHDVRLSAVRHRAQHRLGPVQLALVDQQAPEVRAGRGGDLPRHRVAHHAGQGPRPLGRFRRAGAPGDAHAGRGLAEFGARLPAGAYAGQVAVGQGPRQLGSGQVPGFRVPGREDGLQQSFGAFALALQDQDVGQAHLGQPGDLRVGGGDGALQELSGAGPVAVDHECAGQFDLRQRGHVLRPGGGRHVQQFQGLVHVPAEEGELPEHQ
ncbi:hypothetical protein Slala03_61490 [Streptomyces lavendulae subsp. lavendulae]|nr:hypothetical protein Slala03_61490 [Streptomyces lavendulae subsp. lavendulae]